MAYGFRYIANRRLKRGRDEETGELSYYERGDDLPPEQFGSGNALQSAIHMGYVSAVPVLDDEEPAQEHLQPGNGAPSATRRAKLRTGY